MQQYLSLVKFSHSIFAMPFALAGFFLALSQQSGKLDWEVLAFVMVCMVTARTAAMAFNRFLDRDIDAKNPRTAQREIPVGKISARSALIFTIINALLFMLGAFFINPLCFALSPVALLVILGYSYTKRFTALCHLVLGLGLGLAPLGAYIAVAEQFDLLPILLGLTVFFWVSGFDVIYALQDEEFDRKQGLKSIPQILGKSRALSVSRLLHCSAIVVLVWMGSRGEFGALYWLGVGVFALFILMQQLLVKPHDLSKVNLAFFTMNGVASFVFAAFFISELYWRL